MIKNEVLDKLYREKRKIEIKKLELEKKKIDLLLELKKLLDNNGRKEIQQQFKKDYGIYFS
ncbi:MAG: hypothetical protein ACTSRP_20815 [Candidatus Helarchaeota archaeon]